MDLSFRTIEQHIRSILLVICVWGLTMTHFAEADGWQSELPREIGSWTAEPADRLYDPITIFEYIDGAGEVYRAYNMRSCLSRRFETRNGPAIVLDLFDMGSSEDAFGVFTHDTDGDVVDIGQDGRIRPGWLSFWKHRFFVSIYAEEETATAAEAVAQLARLVASLIPQAGNRPKILDLLPTAGLNSNRIRYLHHPVVLNYHYYLADENILNLTPKTDAVLAEYQREEAHGRLLLVNYPTKRQAQAAFAGFRRHYLRDADSSGTARLENNKWATARTHDRLLVIVLEADSRELAEGLVQAVKH
jgi:Family of unknown function (DUF6599)